MFLRGLSVSDLNGRDSMEWYGPGFCGPVYKILAGDGMGKEKRTSFVVT